MPVSIGLACVRVPPVRYTALGNVTLNYLKTAHKSVVSNCSFGLYAIANHRKHVYSLSQ
ncbi:MAG: hypothetical protein RIG63_08735 [Coleofasciculus chthonoplastes F3-SA18-01]|uniref:hypothetical protein n=1 Tax=Coleofasciculus chthonoplastes TaxID=64178 RepID=UPI003304F2C6